MGRRASVWLAGLAVVATAGCGADEPTAADWLDETVAALQSGGSVHFAAHHRPGGAHVVEMTGTGDLTGYRARIVNGPDAVGPEVEQDVEASEGRMRLRTRSDEPGLSEGWHDVEDGGGLGLAPFHRDGTDLVTILARLEVDETTGGAGGAGIVARADLRLAVTALSGMDLVDEQGSPALPAGATVPLELAPGPAGTWRLDIDGTVVFEALQELGLDGSGSLSGALGGVDLEVDYAVAD